MRPALVFIAAALAASVYAGNPNASNCTEKWFTQVVDHFSYSNQQTYQQRYYVYDAWWSHKSRCPGKGEAVGPIFFYTGNEADVTSFVNATGLMWENAQSFGANLVFAEHRYYGQSQPFGSESDDPKNLQFLTHEQALADYASLLMSIREDMVNGLVSARPECAGTLQPADIPVITFGGSYGGMLSAWFRMKYPDIVDGAIAASAPIAMFPGVAENYTTSDIWWQTVTDDATSAGGASDSCAVNVRASWQFIFQQAQTPEGLQQLSQVFRTCTPLTTQEDVHALAVYLMNAWDSMATGNYPYPDNYMTGGGNPMPAYPVRVACGFMSDPTLSGWRLMAAAEAAASVFNNVSASLTCNPLPLSDIEEDGIWDYQWCTQLLPQETYFTFDSSPNMFWNSPMNFTFINDHCQKKYGVTPRQDWILTSYGTLEDIGRYASNIVFTNGKYDPWHTGGVLTTLNKALPSILMDGCAHHLDLFFTNPADPAVITATRKFQMSSISDWLASRAASRGLAYAANHVM